VLLVHRPSYDDWSLPKGKLDPGEEPLTCALREVTEETAVECHAGPELGTVRYSETNRRTGTSVMKEVTFFEMHPVSAGHHAPDDEVDDIAWLLLDQARDRCTYPTDRQIIDLLASRITSRT
jgi:8-oxo-dGTP diphosphatase